jgi:aminoglycoside phosphotransferase (APT) family kinase protein
MRTVPDLPDNARPMGRRQDRVHRFIARVDSHLPTLADDGARRAFLDRQLEGWERRYARFIATEGQSEPVAAPGDPPLAADFLLTITGLAARRVALDEHARIHA